MYIFKMMWPNADLVAHYGCQAPAILTCPVWVTFEHEPFKSECQ